MVGPGPTKLIVGLGNPGSRYLATRHNIGRRVLEALRKDCGAAWKKNKTLRAQWAQSEHQEFPLTLALPDCYMNESGGPVAALVSHFQINSQTDLLIVADDVVLPLGTLRLRAKGSDGGHRGLRSIEQALGSQNYARLRIGVGSSQMPLEPLEEYVLNPFTPQEAAGLPSVLEQALKACYLWVRGPMEQAMNRTNLSLA